MTRSWIHKAMIGAAVAAFALTVAGTTVLAADDDTILVGISAERGPQVVEKLVIRNNNVPYVYVPGPPVDEPPPKYIPAGASSVKPTVGSVASDGLNLGGGIGLIASATPQMRLEKSLKDLALDLR